MKRTSSHYERVCVKYLLNDDGEISGHLLRKINLSSHRGGGSVKKEQKKNTVVLEENKYMVVGLQGTRLHE
jgi:hypothetical protein